MAFLSCKVNYNSYFFKDLTKTFPSFPFISHYFFNIEVCLNKSGPVFDTQDGTRPNNIFQSEMDLCGLTTDTLDINTGLCRSIDTHT